MDHSRNGFGDSSYLKNEGQSNTFEIQSDLVPHAPIFTYVVDFAPQGIFSDKSQYFTRKNWSQSNNFWRANRLSKNLNIFISQQHMHLERLLGFFSMNNKKLFSKPLQPTPYPSSMIHLRLCGGVFKRFLETDILLWFILVNKVFIGCHKAPQGFRSKKFNIKVFTLVVHT